MYVVHVFKVAGHWNCCACEYQCPCYLWRQFALILLLAIAFVLISSFSFLPCYYFDHCLHYARTCSVRCTCSLVFVVALLFAHRYIPFFFLLRFIANTCVCVRFIIIFFFFFAFFLFCLSWIFFPAFQLVNCILITGYLVLILRVIRSIAN